LPWWVRLIAGAHSASRQLPLKVSSQASWARVQTAMFLSSIGVQPLMRPK